MPRDWKPRRLVITEKIIAFALIGDTIVIDQIPLHEVRLVQSMTKQSDASSDKEDKEKKRRISFKTFSNSIRISMNDFEDSIMFANAIQISTEPEGFNSGVVM